MEPQGVHTPSTCGPLVSEADMGASAMRMPAGPAAAGQGLPGTSRCPVITRSDRNPPGTAGRKVLKRPLEGQCSQPRETSPSVCSPSGWAIGTSPSGDHAISDWPGRPGNRTPGFPVQVVRNAVACLCASGQKQTPLWAVPTAGSDRGVIAAPPVVARLTDGQPARVVWGDAGPCQGRAQLTLASFVARLTHTRHRAQSERKEGVDRRLPWAVSAQRGMRLSPAVTGLTSDAPREGFWHFLAPEMDGLAMSAEGQMGEPPWSLCCFRAAGRRVWDPGQHPGTRLRRPRWSLATGFDLRELGAAQRPWQVEGLSLLTRPPPGPG